MIDILAFLPTIGQIIWYIIIIAITTGIGYLLREKPDDPDAATLDQLELPTCELGTPYPMIFGTPPRFKGCMVLWYGDLYAHKIRVNDVTIGYAYYLGVHMGICHGNVDGVLQLWAEEFPIWPRLNDKSHYADDYQTSTGWIAGHDLWGGRKKGGGVGGDVDILYGEVDQPVNDYLVSKISPSIPAFRGILTLVFRKWYWGKSPQLPMIQFVVRRTGYLHAGGAQWYLGKARMSNNFDLNVVHVIRELLTSDIAGLGISTDLIDATSFEDAADVCYTEELGISYRYVPHRGAVKDFLVLLERIMSGVLYWDHATGLYKIKLIRDDYVEGDLSTYTEDDFDIEFFMRPAMNSVPAQTIVWYTDRDSAKRAPAYDKDAAIGATQNTIPTVQELDYLPIVDSDVASFLAAREQYAVSRMPAAMTLVAKRTMHAINRGDVFKISHPKLAAAGLLTMTVRAINIGRGTLENGTIHIDVAEDVFGTPTVTLGSMPTSNWSVPTATEGTDYEVNSVEFEEVVIATLNESVG
jgi:hypothetical protein